MTEYGFALNRLANSAYPRMPPEAREDLAIDQFISGLPSKDLKKHVQFGHPQSLDSAIALATEFDSFEGQINEQKSEELPIQTVTKKENEDNVLKVLTEIVKGRKTLANEFRSQVPNKNQSFPNVMHGQFSYNCGQDGYVGNLSPNPRVPHGHFPTKPHTPYLPSQLNQTQSNSTLGTLCGRCHVVGHNAKACRQSSRRHKLEHRHLNRLAAW